MNKFCKRLRYSVGGTYRLYGPRQMPESMISEAHASFVSSSQVFFAWSSLQCLLLYLIIYIVTNMKRATNGQIKNAE